MDEILDGIVNLVHKSWQFPEIAHSKIIFDDEKEILCQHGRFSIEEKWSQSAEIKVHKKQVGVITVFYTEEKPQADEGVFLREERLLLNVIAERLGKIIEQTQAEEALKKSEERFRTLVANIPGASYWHPRRV